MGRTARRSRSEQQVNDELVAELRELALPLATPDDLDPLLARIGDARYVLLGEASHGTHEYYTWRAAISRRLIAEKGFSFLAVEGDWPDCYRINRFIKGYGDSGDTAREALHSFERWPTWMWANEEMVELVEWLHAFNETVDADRHVGFFGLDVYSLWDSLYQVMGHLQKYHPQLLPAARRAFECFEPYGEDAQNYAQAVRWMDATCEDEVLKLLGELQRSTADLPGDDRERHFNAQQNALVAKNADAYYRTMILGGSESWNVRDRHMVETLDRLMQWHGSDAKVIVWEHNTHIGDARYTDMADDGMINVGQLVREQHSDDGVVLVGFASYQGTVVAGQAWDAPAQRMQLPAAPRGSWEDILHRAGPDDKLLIFAPGAQSEAMLMPRGQRAVGVVYHPQYERGHYVPTELFSRYDALLYLDITHALHPLHEVAGHEQTEVPETFPSGW